MAKKGMPSFTRGGLPVKTTNPVNAHPKQRKKGDGASAGPRAGMNEWIKQAIAASNGSLWNNGSWGQRDMRGKPGSLSVHATGRAVDLSYRKSEKHPKAGRKEALVFIDKLVANANDLGLQCVLDYFPEPQGRAWRCDRYAWQK